MKKNHRWHKAEESMVMNLTPLVDVMFILLIFLVVTAHYSALHSINVDLPKAESAEATGDIKAIVISLTKDEKVYLAGSPITMEKLRFEIKNLSKQKPQPVVLIQADEKVATGRLVSVMDTVSQAGLSKISLQTERGEVQ